MAEKYHAFGTPTAVSIRQDGVIGSYPVGGADAIRRLVAHKGWTESGFAALLKAGTQSQAPSAKPTLPVGTAAPAFTLPDLEGGTLSLNDLNGQATLLLFWNVACGFCQRMLPQLVEWEKTKPARSPRLVLVSSGSRDANAQMNLKSTIVMDERFAVGSLYGAGGTPSAVLIDARGEIASTLTVGGTAVMELLGGQERQASATVALASAS